MNERLLSVLKEMDRVAVALSGGVDSAVVAAAAFRALGTNALAVTADSPSVARRDLDDAKRVATFIGIRHEVVRTDEFTNPDYAKNDGTRCYFCKSELYTAIARRLPEWNMSVICSGANLDDNGDYRPGLIAASEHRVRHPLQEAGFSKADVRRLAAEWNLPVADKPASPCLSSRIAPGVAVTLDRTTRIEKAEAYLRAMNIADCRVRVHADELARIEVPSESITHIAEHYADITSCFQQLGFRYITLDLAGLRSGSLNDLVSLEVRVAVNQTLQGVS